MASQVRIDCYGNIEGMNSTRFLNTIGEKYPVLVDEQDSVTYIAFDVATAGNQPIHKITEDGTVTTIMWGYGEWSNRATITYDKTKNQPRTVNLE